MSVQQNCIERNATRLETKQGLTYVKLYRKVRLTNCCFNLIGEQRLGFCVLVLAVQSDSERVKVNDTGSLSRLGVVDGDNAVVPRARRFQDRGCVE